MGLWVQLYCWKLPLNQSKQNGDKAHSWDVLLKALKVPGNFSCLNLKCASGLSQQEQLHRAFWENGIAVVSLASCPWLRAPQRLAAGSRPAALLRVPVPCCVLSPERFSSSLACVRYLGLLADGELLVSTTGNIWFLVPSLESVHRRVLHKLLQLPMQGEEIRQLLSVFWFRKVMTMISENSRKCGAYSSQQPGGGRWVWKTELRGDSSSSRLMRLGCFKHVVGGKKKS